MAWKLYENDKFLEPLKFSNGKTQEDVVNEVVDLIKKGNKVIFIHGVCGTGKSAIALNLARELGRASIVVPIRNLQMQYKKDYENEKYLMKDNGEKLQISVITGRKNHKCKFLEDSQNAIPKITREVNSRLHDIFSGKREKLKETISDDLSADNQNIPCKIEIREKNVPRIKEYLKRNKDVNEKDFSEIKDVNRVSVGGTCPYWSPVLPATYELGGKSFTSAKKRKYMGMNNKEFVFYERKEGCPFYQQFHSYIDSDVIVFNSLKYKLESILGRKPATEIEIVDEGDEFLDKFSNQKNLNIDRLINSLNGIFEINEETANLLFEIREIANHLKNDTRIKNAVEEGEILPLKNIGIYDLFRIFLKNPEFLNDIDEENYLFEIEEAAKTFEEFFDDTYVTFYTKNEQLVASIVTTNLAKNFKKMVDNNKAVVLMSGTLHSEEVLKEIFGLEDFKIVEAETEQQGQINVVRTGFETDCRYSNFSNGNNSREKYLKALDKSIEIATRPTLVHVNSFTDLPSDREISELELKHLISRDELMNSQNEDTEGNIVDEFKAGEKDVLFSTRASRGIDFPGEQCNSIVFTKYPNPNVQDAFWKILNKTRPQHYWNFYKDKAKRELLQKIYRGLRFKEDKIELLSPDTRVLEVFEVV